MGGRNEDKDGRKRERGGGVGLGWFMDEKSRRRARPRKYTTYSGKAKICVEGGVFAI